ncbi:MAG: DNA-3-methyladenine glycosylase I [Candidatus Cloacimonadaceae bacterium]|nr:DNA-3-methyladenine glycosylase I [Candidatus Cloacimonadaceae bacterium]MDP3113959.1 DNA-3-methyladenine glycosylase I [Candidatus Cloacimonadaceae bacterium]
MVDNQYRCVWTGNNPLMIDYHDTEWGAALHDDRKLFEFMVLDSFQAGLSWSCILSKRENFRRAMDNFEPALIAGYDEEKILSLLLDSGIVRNRMKINAAIGNARLFLDLQARHGSFDAFIWQFTDGRTIINHWQDITQIPVSSPQSDAMSLDLKRLGFRFVGTTICYAFMQAAGMVNDHLENCFRYGEVQR